MATLLCVAAVVLSALLGPRVLESFPPGAGALTVTPGLGVEVEDGGGRTLVRLARWGGDSQEPGADCGQQGDQELTCLRSSTEEVSVRRTVEGVTLQCFQVSHKALKAGADGVGQCLSLSSSFWYGGAQLLQQPWPLRDVGVPLTPFVSCDLFSHRRHVGAVLERYFLSSEGVALRVEDDVPLYVSISEEGEQLLCLVARHDGYPYPPPRTDLPELTFTLCQGWDMRTVHKYMAAQYFRRPSGVPDARMLARPVWSTWAQYNKDINQSAVLEFARRINNYGFPHSQLEIDDDWTPHYGDHDFDRKKFPDPAGMVRQLSSMGFRVTVWVHPFMNPGSAALEEAMDKRYVVMKRSGSGQVEPAMVKWWNGEGGLLDVTSAAAVDWFLSKLSRLRSAYNISSFKFDAGETLYLPENYVTERPMTSPDEYATLWAELARRADPRVRHQEVRVGWRSQHEPIFVRMFDRYSDWQGEAGLQTVIPCALHFGLLGYPFVLPDMIGGNAYSDMTAFKGGAFPERTLYIRWLQASALLPAMQFSIAPWMYDDEVVSLALTFAEKHTQLSSLFQQLAEDAVLTGDPIIRPLWWISPSDETAQSISDEFLVGEALLVAPVLKKSARSRDIYLPRGIWVDLNNGETHQGPLWLKDYSAALSELPHFEKKLFKELPQGMERKDEL